MRRFIEKSLRSSLRHYSEGADLSKVLSIPDCIEAVLSHDLVAYPMHACLGALLNRFHAPPAAAGIEWLKAAAHARSAPALARVVAGLTATRARAGAADLDTVLRGAVVRPVTLDGRDVRMRQRQLAALARAGIARCDAEAAANGDEDGTLASS